MSLSIRVGADLHGYLPLVEECDILLLLGDIFPWNDLTPSYQRKWQKEVFLPWLEHQPAEETIILAGNHDFLWQEEAPKGNFHYLADSEVALNGIRFWGTPWTPPKKHSNKIWAFKKSEKEIGKLVNQVPEGIDVLLSHGPPWGVGDWTGSRHAGSKALEKIIEKSDPRAVLFGHIHECGGPTVHKGRLYLNATLGRRNSNLWKIDWSQEGIFWEKN